MAAIDGSELAPGFCADRKFSFRCGAKVGDAPEFFAANLGATRQVPAWWRMDRSIHPKFPSRRAAVEQHHQKISLRYLRTTALRRLPPSIAITLVAIPAAARMNRFAPARLVARDVFQTVSRPRLALRPLWQWNRTFSQSPARQTQQDGNKQTLMESFTRGVLGESLIGEGKSVDDMTIEPQQSEEPYHFHIFSTKHNTHVTVTKPNRDAILSLSCGNLGFRKSQRKTYDSAYQLGAYTLDKLNQMGVTKEIHKLEVVLRGFGQGREAVTKVLLGNEGKVLRGKIIRVSDSTRLKFGGTRSKKPRRLG